MGVRGKVDKWMKTDDRKIIGFQETRVNQNSRETRKQDTWLFSGEAGCKEHAAGKASIIHYSCYEMLIIESQQLTE